MLSLLDQAGAKVMMVHVEWELPHRGRGKLKFFEYKKTLEVCNHNPDIVEYEMTSS